MRCHRGIPLSSPVLPPLSRAVHLIPSLSLSLSLLTLFQCKLSPLCDPCLLALLFCFCLLLALSLVVYLSPLPLPLSPSLSVTAGMQLFNEHPSFASLSIISPQYLHVVSLFHCTALCSITAATVKHLVQLNMHAFTVWMHVH